MTRPRTDTTTIDADIARHWKTVREALGPLIDGTDLDESVAVIETQLAVGVRVMRQTRPSTLRDIARTFELKARLDGIPVAEQRPAARQSLQKLGEVICEKS